MPLTSTMMQTLDGWLSPVKDKLPSSLDEQQAQALYQAITQESLRRLRAFLDGVRSYQDFPESRPDAPDVAVVWQDGTTRLLDYAPGSFAPVLFVVPSLVNRFEILDIDPEHSFLRYMVKAGLRPVVVDWQEPGDVEKAFTLDDYILRRLEPAFEAACGLQGGRACAVLGYCMGGLLALALTQRQRAKVTCLTLMATPWDFAAKGVGGVPSAQSPIGQSFVQQAHMWQDALAQMGWLPADLLQGLFTSFQSLQVLHKFMRFSTQDLPEQMRRFVLTEDWLNNGVPLSLPVARTCLHDWYEHNLTAKGQWRVGGEPIDPSRLDLPVYVMAPTRDKIVPPESALPLAKVLPSATLVEPELGHIGLMTGDEAPAKVWGPYLSWLGHFVFNPQF